MKKNHCMLFCYIFNLEKRREKFDTSKKMFPGIPSCFPRAAPKLLHMAHTAILFEHGPVNIYFLSNL